MTTPNTNSRRLWRFRVWALMLVPVACAPVFLWLAQRNRVPPVERGEREHHWTLDPLNTEFEPKEGTRVASGDDLVKLARVEGPWGSGRYYGTCWYVTPDAMLHYQWHNPDDAGGDTVPAPAEGLARLPALLRKLPPTDPAAGPKDRLLVAFPSNGRWVVRTYRRDALPKEVDDLAKALNAQGF
ncbi:MAG TPA: hypothetical protein VGY53_07575 [Isosphaeraceae bacterium]|nr:hypothetical protein [Isosphaeraceae bacterium]